MKGRMHLKTKLLSAILITSVHAFAQVAAPSDEVLRRNMSAPPTFSGPLFSPQINGTYYANGFPGSDIWDKANNAFAACSNNCRVLVPPGTYNVATTLRVTAWTQSIACAGPKGSCVINYSGSTEAILFQMANFHVRGKSPVTNAGEIEGFTIVGTPSAQAGIHTGNVVGSVLRNLKVSGFTGPSAACILVENRADSTGYASWYERNDWYGVETGVPWGDNSAGCTNGVVFRSVPGGADSFEYNELHLRQNINASQIGVLFDGTRAFSWMHGGHFWLTSNATGVPGGTLPEAVKLSGHSQVNDMAADIHGELGCAKPGCSGIGVHVEKGAKFQVCGPLDLDAFKMKMVDDNGGENLATFCPSYNQILAVGTDPAHTGVIRVSNGQGIWSRDGSNAGDVHLFLLDKENNFQLAPSKEIGSVYLGSVGVASPAKSFDSHAFTQYQSLWSASAGHPVANNWSSKATNSGALSQLKITQWSPAKEITAASVQVPSLQISPSGTRPACAEATRGVHWMSYGEGSKSDSEEVCIRNAHGTYSWHSIIGPDAAN
jgi:hypothetical protein